MASDGIGHGIIAKLRALSLPGLEVFFPRYANVEEATQWQGPELSLRAEDVILLSKGGLRCPDLTSGEHFAALELALLHLGRGNSPVAISLSEDLCLISDYAFPRTGDRQITSMLALRRARVQPLGDDEIIAGWHECPNSGPTDTTSVRQIVLKKSVVTEILDAVSSVGRDCSLIFLRSPTGTPLPIAWSRDGSPYGRSTFDIWKKRFAIVCGFTALLGFATYTLLARTEMAKMQDLQNEIAAALEKSKTVQKQLLLQTARIAAVDEIKKHSAESHRRLELVETLSKLLPDDVYLTRFSIQKNDVNLEGAATKPEAMIATLESSPSLSKVAFLAPVFRNPGEEKSRFSIRMLLENDMVAP